ncbi:MAG: LamG-like jellyroll fold domain-containing protein [Prosthecobacter sp.]|nr:LamG-like jellyroll fold domain-containing protein [Prosthecobacter sp.]
MPTDLTDALIAWQGGDISEARCQELLTRLREDAEFRATFAGEIWMLSLTRTAQAPSPRWLELCEELGIQPASRPEVQAKLESVVMQGVQGRPLRVVRQWWRTAAVGGIGIAAALALYLGLQLFQPAPRRIVDAGPLATILQSTVRWSAEGTNRPGKGQNVHAGILQLEAGTLTMLFKSGVILLAEGPALLELVSGDQVFCHRGHVRTRVPKGAEGFRVELPHGLVTDLGTEMGVKVEPDGRARVAVYEGLAEATLNLKNQDGVRTEPVAAREALQMTPQTGAMKKSAMDDILPAIPLSLPSLIMRSDYARAVRAARPRHYWRLNRAEAGLIPDEMPGGLSLRMGAGVSLQQDERGQQVVDFAGTTAGTGLRPTGPWSMRHTGWAVELWFVGTSLDQSSLASLALAEDDPLHVFLLGYNSNAPNLEDRSNLRFLTRWPAESRGGVNLYSRPTFLPYQWHHVVAQQQGRRMELWVDGIPSGKGIADEQPVEIEGHLSIGVATILAPVTHAPVQGRPLKGRMAEIALYDRVLTVEEIRQHAAIGGKE